MTALTLYDKLVASHTVGAVDEQHLLLYCDLHIMNEYTSPQAFAGLAAAQRAVRAPHKNFAVVSHIIPTHAVAARDRVIFDPASALQASNLKRNCALHGIELLDTTDPAQGIEHIVAPERGLVRPGMVILCGDSHTTTYGALGALGFGVGTSDVEHILATQTLVYRPAANMRIHVNGALPIGGSSKDIILFIIARIGAQGARGFAVEFCGSTIDALSVEARMTICNMAVEAGARAALIAPDAKVLAYVGARARNLSANTLTQATAFWQTLKSDAAATFSVEHHFRAEAIAPFVTWGTSPDQAIAIDALLPTPSQARNQAERRATEQALHYIGLEGGAPLEGTPLDRVFIGSCTNSRIEDLRIVAALVRGKKAAKNVRVMVVPGSGAVLDQAEAEGLAQVFLDAGFEWRQPGCSMCLAMNDDVLAPDERCASTTNRNFEGRQGRASRTHLMSPAMAAAAAITGRITDVRRFAAESAPC